MNQYQDHYSEEIWERNFWIVQLLFGLVALMFIILTASFVCMLNESEKEIKKTAVHDNGSFIKF